MCIASCLISTIKRAYCKVETFPCVEEVPTQDYMYKI